MRRLWQAYFAYVVYTVALILAFGISGAAGIVALVVTGRQVAGDVVAVVALGAVIVPILRLARTIHHGFPPPN